MTFDIAPTGGGCLSGRTECEGHTCEWDEVAALARGTVERGSAARRQCEIFARNQRLEDVVDFVIAETARG